MDIFTMMFQIFPISFLLPLRNMSTKKKSTYIFKRIVNNNSVKNVSPKLYETYWNWNEISEKPTEFYIIFFEKKSLWLLISNQKNKSKSERLGKFLDNSRNKEIAKA